MIKIDLRSQLTDEAINLALSHLGTCTYAAPCIIGAMIPKERRQAVDDWRNPETGQTGQVISILTKHNQIEFAHPDQMSLARELQSAFDNGDREHFLEKVIKVRRELLLT